MDTNFLQLERLPLYIVFRMAFAQSGKNTAQAAELLGHSKNYWDRVISSEDYYPRADRFPEICQKLGNTLIVDWMLAQTRVLAVNQANPVDAAALPLRTNDLVAKFSPIATAVKAVCADKHLSHAEHKQVARAIQPLINEGISLISDLSEKGEHA